MDIEEIIKAINTLKKYFKEKIEEDKKELNDLWKSSKKDYSKIIEIENSIPEYEISLAGLECLKMDIDRILILSKRNDKWAIDKSIEMKKFVDQEFTKNFLDQYIEIL